MRVLCQNTFDARGYSAQAVKSDNLGFGTALICHAALQRDKAIHLGLQGGTAVKQAADSPKGL